MATATPQPKITIQIVGWNSAAALPLSLPVLEKIPPPEAHIHYLDNASHDNSVDLVRQVLPHAIITQLPRNLGFGGAHNIGIVKCQTPFILVHNPDVAVNWQGIKSLLGLFEDEGLGAVQGKLLRFERSGSRTIIDSAGIVLSSALNGIERGANEADFNQYAGIINLIAATGACALFRVEALRTIAYAGHEVFDEHFFAYKEDVDVGWRLKRAGWRVLYAPIEMGRHERALGRRGKMNWGLTPAGIYQRLRDQRTYYSLRNWLWLIIKNASMWQLLCSFVPIVIRIFIFCLLSLFYPPLMRAWVEALVYAPVMLQKRFARTGASKLG